jgi:hypothetical protein
MRQLQHSPLAATLLDLGPDYMNDWSGTPSELFTALTALAGKKADSPRWPKSPEWLAIELRRITPQLGMHGIIVKVSRCHRGRVVSLARVRTVSDYNADTP